MFKHKGRIKIRKRRLVSRKVSSNNIADNTCWRMTETAMLSITTVSNGPVVEGSGEVSADATAAVGGISEPQQLAASS